MTSWRNNNQKDAFTNPIPNTNPNPFFDVLSNTNDPQNTFENVEGLIEGFKEGVKQFDWEGGGYFVNVPKFKGLSGAAAVGKFLKKIIDYILSPIRNFDKNLQATILKILEVCVLGELMDCNTRKGIKNVSKTDSFTWLKKTFTTNNKEGFKKKGVSYTKAELSKEAIDYKDTIASFITLHPELRTSIKQITTDYINTLNKFYADRGNYVSDMELLEFNNNYEKKLSDPKRKAKFSKPDSTPAPYTPRFTFFKDGKPNTSKIEYFPFNDAYFPLPKDMKSFELALEFDLSNNNQTGASQATIDFLKNRNKPIDPPKKSGADAYHTQKYDPNHIFSIDLSKPKKDTMQKYLSYVIKRLTFGNINCFKTSTYNESLFIYHLTRTGNAYELYINSLDSLKYRNTNNYLTSIEIAIFNHLFFYYMAYYDFKNKSISDTSKYKRTGPILQDYGNIISNLPNLSKYFTAFTGYIDEDNVNNTITSENLYKYINLSAAEPFNPKITDFSTDVSKYYNNPNIFAAKSCADQNNVIKDQFNYYAHTIKQEIYRILCIPVVIFIVYNFYYMVFFKDCFDYGKDNNGDFTKSPKDDNCFYPMFPDWERTFHNIEKNKTDFFFEFLFKPVKLFYSLMNAGKAFFRKSMLYPFNDGTLNDNIPYIVFVACFYWIYSIIINKGGIILNTIFGLFEFNIPNIPIFGSFGTNKFVSNIIYICFGISLLKQVFGVDLSGMAAASAAPSAAASAATKGKNALFSAASSFKDSLLSGKKLGGKMTGGAGIDDIMGQAENILGKTWALWILKGITPINFIVRTLITIIYWVLKLIVSRLMIPISMFITTIYTLFIPILGIFSYTDKGHSIFEKMDLIDRFIYTKLYKIDNPLDDNASFMENIKYYLKFFSKYVSWSVIYFLSEIVILYTLITTYQTFDKMKVPSSSKISADIQRKMQKALNGVKHFVYTVCMIFISFLVLWIVYKLKFKNDIMRKSYNNDENGNSNEKVFKMDNNCNGQIPDNKSESSTPSLQQFYDKHPDGDIGDYNNNIDNFKTNLIYADKYNSVAHDYYNEKTGHVERRPMLTGFLNNFTFLNPKGIQDTQEDREENATSSIKNFANTALAGLSNKAIDLTKELGSIPGGNFLKGVNDMIPDANKFRPLENFKNQTTRQNINVSDAANALFTGASKFLGNK